MASSPWCAAASNPTWADGASRLGYVDRGERVEDAAVRETLEETGLHVRLNGLVGLYSETGLHVAVAVYAAEVMCGKLEAGHDAQGAAFFEIGDMPPLPFPHDYPDP